MTLGGRNKSRLVFLSSTSDMFLTFNLKIIQTCYFSFHLQANPGYANFHEGGLANSTEMEIMFSNKFATGKHSWDPYALEINENEGRQGEGGDEVVEEEENIEVIRNVRTEDSGYDDCRVLDISLENIKVDNIDSIKQDSNKTKKI